MEFLHKRGRAHPTLSTAQGLAPASNFKSGTAPRKKRFSYFLSFFGWANASWEKKIKAQKETTFLSTWLKRKTRLHCTNRISTCYNTQGNDSFKNFFLLSDRSRPSTRRWPGNWWDPNKSKAKRWNNLPVLESSGLYWLSRVKLFGGKKQNKL